MRHGYSDNGLWTAAAVYPCYETTKYVQSRAPTHNIGYCTKRTLTYAATQRCFVIEAPLKQEEIVQRREKKFSVAGISRETTNER